MKKTVLIQLCIMLLSIVSVNAQDTFSIVAADSITGEVGSAGASCVDLYNFTGYSNDFLGELFPGIGAINTQAAYDASNQATARNRMNAGDTPTQIINYLVANDVAADPTTRQYGVIRLIGGSPKTAGYTGSNCLNYKNHIAGKNYCIQGNILLGQQVLDSIESRFKREPGDLACKLMAALQGAKMIGADSRCAPNGTSSLFAFIKVSKPSDTFGNPYFKVSLKTHDNAGIEPIDSLQKLFNIAHAPCGPASVNELDSDGDMISIYPNPATNSFVIKIAAHSSREMTYTINDMLGRKITEGQFNAEKTINISKWKKGVYFIELTDGITKTTKRIVKQ